MEFNLHRSILRSVVHGRGDGRGGARLASPTDLAASEASLLGLLREASALPALGEDEGGQQNQEVQLAARVEGEEGGAARSAALLCAASHDLGEWFLHSGKLMQAERLFRSSLDLHRAVRTAGAAAGGPARFASIKGDGYHHLCRVDAGRLHGLALALRMLRLGQPHAPRTPEAAGRRASVAAGGASMEEGGEGGESGGARLSMVLAGELVRLAAGAATLGVGEERDAGGGGRLGRLLLLDTVLSLCQVASPGPAAAVPAGAGAGGGARADVEVAPMPWAYRQHLAAVEHHRGRRQALAAANAVLGMAQASRGESAACRSEGQRLDTSGAPQWLLSAHASVHLRLARVARGTGDAGAAGEGAAQAMELPADKSAVRVAELRAVAAAAEATRAVAAEALGGDATAIVDSVLGAAQLPASVRPLGAALAVELQRVLARAARDGSAAAAEALLAAALARLRALADLGEGLGGGAGAAGEARKRKREADAEADAGESPLEVALRGRAGARAMERLWEASCLPEESRRAVRPTALEGSAGDGSRGRGEGEVASARGAARRAARQRLQDLVGSCEKYAEAQREAQGEAQGEGGGRHPVLAASALAGARDGALEAGQEWVEGGEGGEEEWAVVLRGLSAAELRVMGKMLLGDGAAVEALPEWHALSRGEAALLAALAAAWQDSAPGDAEAAAEAGALLLRAGRPAEAVRRLAICAVHLSRDACGGGEALQRAAAGSALPAGLAGALVAALTALDPPRGADAVLVSQLQARPDLSLCDRFCGQLTQAHARALFAPNVMERLAHRLDLRRDERRVRWVLRAIQRPQLNSNNADKVRLTFAARLAYYPASPLPHVPLAPPRPPSLRVIAVVGRNQFLVSLLQCFA